MTNEELDRQQRHRWRPRKGSPPTFDGATGVAATTRYAYDRLVPHPIVAGLCFLVAAILVVPAFDGLVRITGVDLGVLAAPCMTGNTSALGGEGEGGGAVIVNVTPETGLNPTMFDCEGGDFDVSWSGTVIVNGTIHIGVGTTVNITGDGANLRGNSSGELDVLTANMSIPRGLTSTVERFAPSNVPVVGNKSTPSGPLFFVDGGELNLHHMAIRGGNVTPSTDYPTASGGGIHAQNASVTAMSCEFEDNFAESGGGGVFAHASTLVMIDSVFRRCRAGFQAEAGDDVSGAGGGINVGTALDTLAMVDFHAR